MTTPFFNDWVRPAIRLLVITDCIILCIRVHQIPGSSCSLLVSPQVRVVITTSLIFAGNGMWTWSQLCIRTRVRCFCRMLVHTFPDFHSLRFIQLFFWKRGRECKVACVRGASTPLGNADYFFCSQQYLYTVFMGYTANI